MIQANEFMCLSTGPGHRKDNARLFKMFTSLDKSKGGILSGLLFNESNKEIETAFFETQAGTDGENSDVPLIYSIGSKTNDRTWCRLVQDLFPDEAEIDEAIMKRPQILLTSSMSYLSKTRRPETTLMSYLNKTR